MQAKVSMVIPCYNKEKDIADMFQSIYEQIWDNIELILVNDGSTDRTREIIAVWEEKFKLRGYQVLVIDQENAGVCAAAKAGLERISGEYVCQVDADDELDPAYVSTMAGWLEKNPDYSYAVCDFIPYAGKGGKKVFSSFLPKAYDNNMQNLAQQCIVNQLFGTVWLYMLRTSYFKKCGVIKNYSVKTRASHEPGFILPVNAFGGKAKYFSLPLYHFNMGGEGMSPKNRDFAFFEQYYASHCALFKNAIQALPETTASRRKKEWLNTCVDFAMIKLMAEHGLFFNGGQAQEKRIMKELADFANQISGAHILDEEEVKKHLSIIIRAISNRLTENTPENIFSLPGRVIAYGAKGRNASIMLPLLNKTGLKPDLLWDKAAKAGDNFEGLPITQPDFDSLSKNDTVLVLPSKLEVVFEIQSKLDAISLFKVLHNKELIDYIGYYIYNI